MPNNPREVFENPTKFWDFLTAKSDEDFEGQHFDRKEAGLAAEFQGPGAKAALRNVRAQIQECVSAFANENVEGGLLVLGISTKGEVKGLQHLDECQLNALVNIGDLLRNQSARTKILECKDLAGNDRQICLVLAPYTPNAICESPGNHPQAWKRSGRSNLPIDQPYRDQLCRDKKIVDFERALCCSYDPALLDRGVLTEFRRSHGEAIRLTDEELLYHEGALEKSDGKYCFTNAGLLFFASNPQRSLRHAYIRLLRFAVKSDTRGRQRGATTFERDFSGSLSQQIRDMRTFFKESGFFKRYSRRNPSGGFVEEPEFPDIAIDEAIVNAVAHRDYALSLPIECESYPDAFFVFNPGAVRQRNHDLPNHFNLAETVLDHTPRNSLLLEWLKRMKDEHGTAFVRALSEGTKKMQEEMSKLRLPSPQFVINASQTCVSLFNNSEEREALLKNETASPATEFANLFPIDCITKEGGKADSKSVPYDRKEFTSTLKDALAAKGWFIDSLRFGRLTAHQRGQHLQTRKDVSDLLLFFPAYSFQFHHYYGRLFLSIDYALEVKSALTLNLLLGDIPAEAFVDMTVVAKERAWFRGRIASVGQEASQVFFREFDREASIPNDHIYPQLPKRLMEELLTKRGIKFDLHQAIKQHSLSLEPNAARIRAEKTRAIAELVSERIFPLAMGPLQVALRPEPEKLIREATGTDHFRTASLAEPTVEFSHQHESSNIRDGITKFGAHQSAPKDIEIIPVCGLPYRDRMASLIQRLQTGQFKYRGAERTFATKFRYATIVTVPTPERSHEECERLTKQHPEWVGDKSLSRIFLIHTPENDYALDDETSPYYCVKRLLFENGIPCQMLDSPTLQNPDWKDLNLALNISAKCGVTPWVLPGAIPDADFLVGLSYTQSGRGEKLRLMGYANVFNNYGRWMFYSGSAAAFDYAERTTQFEALTKKTLERLNLSETPSIYFHYSSKFSKEDKEAILKAARSVRPAGTYYFVWINTHHNIRLYDSRPETDGSLGRGSYVRTSNWQFFLSTTGYNPFRKTLGTPHMLEINASVNRPKGSPEALPDTKGLAMQILSLTKLNWASTDSLCGEPITIKYAGDIAYLTAAFLRQGRTFSLHPALEQTPWFI